MNESYIINEYLNKPKENNVNVRVSPAQGNESYDLVYTGGNGVMDVNKIDIIRGVPNRGVKVSVETLLSLVLNPSQNIAIKRDNKQIYENYIKDKSSDYDLMDEISQDILEMDVDKIDVNEYGILIIYV